VFNPRNALQMLCNKDALVFLDHREDGCVTLRFNSSKSYVLLNEYCIKFGPYEHYRIASPHFRVDVNLIELKANGRSALIDILRGRGEAIISGLPERLRIESVKLSEELSARVI
jgi:hypothetical protein